MGVSTSNSKDHKQIGRETVYAPKLCKFVNGRNLWCFVNMSIVFGGRPFPAAKCAAFAHNRIIFLGKKGLRIPAANHDLNI